MTREPYASARTAFWVVDNGSSHRGQTTIDRLAARYPNAVMVHTPVHASWLNQVERMAGSPGGIAENWEDCVMARKRKTLPKDFAELLKASDLDALKAVFDSCEMDARGGYSKCTALAFPKCPDELARWLVANGLDVDAVDSYRRTPLRERAGYFGGIDVLIELGADVNAPDKHGETALHAAAAR